MKSQKIRHGALALVSLVAAAPAAHAAVVISDAATKHMSCSAGVCSPTAKNAVLNAGDLATMLAASDVKVTTGAGAVAIGVSAPVTWTSANRLTLDSNQGVAVKAAVVSEGIGGLTVTLNDGGTGGDLTFFPGASISFWDNASSLVVDGNSYTLVSDIATLAADIAAAPSGFYALAKDYDATADGTYTNAPVPTILTGTFEGLGHTIADLSIAPAAGAVSHVGLFTETDGTARDIALANANLVCGSTTGAAGLLAGMNKGDLIAVSVAGHIGCIKGSEVGGIAGMSDQPGMIVHATAAIAIDGTQAEFGGIAGGNSGTISSASVSGTATGGLHAIAGGIAGVNGALIEDSHSSVALDVPKGADVGGIAGYLDGTIERCSATGNIRAKNVAGGLVGVSFVGVVDASFATGSVRAVRYAGGLLGWDNGVTNVSNSYAKGAAKVGPAAGNYAGGLVGRFENGNSVKTSWSSGAVSGGVVGGLLGYVQNATATDGYWNLDTSGVSNPADGAGNQASFAGISGLTTAQFQSALPSGFDPAIWGQSGAINNGFPYLLANPP
jgi:hypothetical protein